MTTIFFSQGVSLWDPMEVARQNNAPYDVIRVVELGTLPVNYRCLGYQTLLEMNPDEVYYTTDEYFILVAQWMVRNKRGLEKLTLVSCEMCRGELVTTEIRVDEQGDIIDDIPGGFFSQRLRYLR